MNVFAYLTLKEILIWQNGNDVVSYAMVLRVAQED